MRQTCRTEGLTLIAWMIALILCAIPGTAWCQAVSALSGTVKNTTGAVVSGANVTALRRTKPHSSPDF